MTTTTVRDAVCGMSIDPNGAAGTSQFQGEPYYFCSPACKEKFDASPAEFSGKAQSAAALGTKRLCTESA